MPEQKKELNPESPKSGILDVVMESEHAHQLADFSPEIVVNELLALLKDREREIVSLRYGLAEQKQATLEAIGKKLGLTRERVRQVEKDSLRQLRTHKQAESVLKPLDIVRKTIADHGGIFAEHALVDHLLMADKTDRSINALLFLLELHEAFDALEESDEYRTSWRIKEFEMEKLDRFHTQIKAILERSGAPADLNRIKSEFRESDVFRSDPQYYTDKVIENFLQITKHVRSNPFGEYGLHNWRVIRPKDVGDKAYLVLKHKKEPMHYTKITELINQHKFDARTAYKETVHNELIMDPRFVLVGRGIYALAEWGYKKGLVSDVIKDILSKANEPLERNKIIDEVLKHRFVRRNTILVGLANKKLFRKVGKSKYARA